jgi:hypothetical protein
VRFTADAGSARACRIFPYSRNFEQEDADSGDEFS